MRRRLWYVLAFSLLPFEPGWSGGRLLVLTSYQFYIQTLYDFVLISFRAPRMSASTRSSTRRSGNPALRAFPSGCVCASRESVTTRRVPRRSYTATCRQSTSRTPRAYTPPLLRIDGARCKCMSDKIGGRLGWDLIWDVSMWIRL